MENSITLGTPELETALLDCPEKRATFIRASEEFIRADLKLDDLNFEYGTFYDKRIEIWSNKKMGYVRLFDLTKIKQAA